MGTVLIVDDNRASRDLIRAILKPVRCDIIEASTGQQALELIQQERPGLVLLDIDITGARWTNGGQDDSGEHLACGLACGRRHGLCHGGRLRKSHCGRVHGIRNKACSRGRPEATGSATARSGHLKERLMEPHLVTIAAIDDDKAASISSRPR